MSTTTEYVVSGMTCQHCVNAVTEEVSAMSGVSDLHIDLESGSLTVTSDAALPFDSVVAAVDEAGYVVTPR